MSARTLKQNSFLVVYTRVALASYQTMRYTVVLYVFERFLVFMLYTSWWLLLMYLILHKSLLA